MVIKMETMNLYLERLPYWDDLSESEKEYIQNHSVIQHYDKDHIVHGCGDACLGMLYVIRGSIRVYLLSEEGREITLFRLEEGDSCVLSASCVISQITFDTQMVVEKDCDLLIVGSGAFSALAKQNVYVRCFMYELLTERFSSVMWTMQQILFFGFDKRLAAFLLSEYERTGSKRLGITHEQIAQQINSAREVVARMLKRFSSDKLLEMKRGEILLQDIAGLRNLIQ